MKIGLLYDLRNPPVEKWFIPWPQYYQQALEHIAEMDRIGFDEVAFCEHHGDPDGYNPSMMVMMTAVAMKTSRVTIGQNILEFPQHHPVRLAEDLATIDILSHGRVELDAGEAGWAFDSEFRALGINPRHRPSRLEEGLDIVRRCWTEDVFSYAGRRFTLQDVRVYPKPLQTPHPPIFATTNGEASMDRVARLGFNACCQGGGGQVTLGDRQLWQVWRERWRTALAKYGGQPQDFRVNTYGTCFVTDDPEKAWAKHRESIFYAMAYRRHDGLQPYIGRWATPPEKPEDLPGWQTTFRTPEDTVKHLRETFGDAAPDMLLLMATRPGIPWEDATEYHHNFATKVLPQVRDLPVKW